MPVAIFLSGLKMNKKNYFTQTGKVSDKMSVMLTSNVYILRLYYIGLPWSNVLPYGLPLPMHYCKIFLLFFFFSCSFICIYIFYWHVHLHSTHVSLIRHSPTSGYMPMSKIGINTRISKAFSILTTQKHTPTEWHHKTLIMKVITIKFSYLVFTTCHKLTGQFGMTAQKNRKK